jgi:glycosyltransferase involved in cell wall biosynthesis
MAVVSVNIPTYHRDDMLRRAVESVLAQSLDDIEVNVSDNGASTRTRDVVESFCDPRIRYLPLAVNIGLFGNLTRCLHLGGAPFVQVLADDDVLYPHSLEERVAALEEAPKAALAHSAFDYLDLDGNITTPFVNWSDARESRYERGDEFTLRTLRAANRILISSALLRREAIAAGQFDPRDGGYADMGLWLRLATKWDFVYVHRPLTGLTIHAGSASSQEGWHEGGRPTMTRDEAVLVRDDKIRFVRNHVVSRRSRRAALREVRKAARRDLTSVIAETASERPFRDVTRDVATAARIEPTLLLTPWPVALTAVPLVGRRPYEWLVARRTPPR